MEGRIAASKLTIDDVLHIRELLKTNIKQAEIARMFGVGPNSIWYIKKNKSYKWIGAAR